MTKTSTIERKARRKKIFFILFFVFLIVIFSGLFILNRWSKKHGFDNAGDFITTVSSNYFASWKAEYETIEITISQNDYDKLASQRSQHLEKGIITKIENRYVPAIISYQNKKIKCKVRLKGHMTDHLQDDKWSFRVKTVSGDKFKEMRIFSLMHPGTRNYIYEWIYHKMLEQEGIATVRYSFLKLRINGDNWGVYALEEHFANELLKNNKRPKGPIIGFNPDLYWQARLFEHEKVKVNLENLKIFASNPEAYDEDEFFKDEKSKLDYVQGIILLEKFKRGKIKTSDVFDIDKLARFHAILDLVGGQFSLDWSDVKYYFNPSTKRIEPIGYESFSVRSTKALCGANKFRKNINDDNWHELLFSDVEFYKLYVHHLNRIRNKKYLDKFFSKHKSSISNNLAILYSEFPYKKMEFNQYYLNQINIATILNSTPTGIAYINDYSNDSLYITFGSNSILPLVIKEIKIGDKLIKLNNETVISSRKLNEHVLYEKVAFKLNEKITKKDLNKISFMISFLGQSKLNEVKLKPILIDENLNENLNLVNKSNVDQFDFLLVDEKEKKIILKSGKHKITQDLIIPTGYNLVGVTPLLIDLLNGSRIISYSPFEFKGTDESPIYFTSSDSTGKGIVLISSGVSNFDNVVFENLGININKDETYNSVLYIYESTVKLSNSSFFSPAKHAIKCFRAELFLINDEFGGFKKSTLDLQFSKLVANEISIVNSKGIGIDAKGSQLDLNQLLIKSVNKGVVLDNGSFLNGKFWVIENSDLGIKSTDFSSASISNLTFSNIKIGFHADSKGSNFGPSFIKVKKLKKNKIKRLKESDDNSVILIE